MSIAACPRYEVLGDKEIGKAGATDTLVHVSCAAGREKEER